MRKPRPHDFCGECGSDLGEIPPPPPRCHQCKRALKGHKGPWGVGRCRYDAPDHGLVFYDTFLKSTMEAYRLILWEMLTEDHPGVLAAESKR